ncbi:S8/S53 family peptidase [Candidatus Woesebacteria bacterium]|nr:S8/S53 family peptidase [Candidatus Woesebacteria bacterium]
MRNPELKTKLMYWRACAIFLALAILGGVSFDDAAHQANVAVQASVPQPIFVPFQAEQLSPESNSVNTPLLPDEIYPGCGVYPISQDADPYTDDQGLNESIIWKDGVSYNCPRPFDGYTYIAKELEQRIPEGNRRPVTIVIMDTGFPETHEDWCATPDINYISKSFIDPKWDATGPLVDVIGHGSVVASIANACSINGIGMPSHGMGDVDIASFKVMFPYGGGGMINPSTFTDALAYLDSVARADPERMFVVNMSFAGFIAWDKMINLINDLPENVVLIAGAGNTNTGLPHEGLDYPAAHPRVISVSASIKTSNDKLCSFSYYAPTDPTSFTATGCGGLWGFSNTESPLPYTGGHAGTSFSSPQLAGLVAYLLHMFPDSSPENIFDVIRATSLTVTQDTKGNPLGPLQHVFPLGTIQELARQAGYEDLATPPQVQYLQFLPLILSGEPYYAQIYTN